MAHAWYPPLETIGDDSGAGVGLVEAVEFVENDGVSVG